MEFNRGVGALLRHEARRYFRESPNVSKALGEIRRNTEPYNTRFALFHAVLDELNEIQMSGGDPGEGYLHASTLGDSDYLTHMPFPTPEYAALVRDEEEVLWNKFRDSEMLNDVLPWIIEERGEFSPTMSAELTQLAQSKA